METKNTFSTQLKSQESMLLIYEILPEEVQLYLIPKEGNSKIEDLLNKVNRFIINTGFDDDNTIGCEAAIELSNLIDPESEYSLNKYLIEDSSGLSSGMNITSVFRAGICL